MFSADRAQHRLGTVLVGLQLGLMGGLGALALPAALQGRAPAGAWLLALASALLGFWALSSNRPGNFNIRPTPREGGQLVQRGPYRWIRHPMYTSVIAFGAACGWASGWLWAWPAVAALVGVLSVKAVFEERWMRAAHPGYAGYIAQTQRFLPWLV